MLETYLVMAVLTWVFLHLGNADTPEIAGFTRKVRLYTPIIIGLTWFIFWPIVLTITLLMGFDKLFSWAGKRK